MSSEPGNSQDGTGEAPDFRGGVESHLIQQALHYLRGVSPAGSSSSWPPHLSRQKTLLLEWAHGVDLLLDPESFLPKLQRGGQEHDLILEEQRVVKVTRGGFFGLSPGVEIVLVDSIQNRREFHLWEATPVEYLERLFLHNHLVPGLNTLLGIISQEDDDLAIVTSQPRFEIVAVTQDEIDFWFQSLGFERVSQSSFYRIEDNLGVFDAHDRNVVRAGNTLIPFDVIPCLPEGGFLEFLQSTIQMGHSVQAVRKITTKTRTNP